MDQVRDAILDCRSQLTEAERRNHHEWKVSLNKRMQFLRKLEARKIRLEPLAEKVDDPLVAFGGGQ